MVNRLFTMYQVKCLLSLLMDDFRMLIYFTEHVPVDQVLRQLGVEPYSLQPATGILAPAVQYLTI